MNYTGPIVYYVPLNESFSYNQLTWGPYTKAGNNYLYAENVSGNVPLEYGPATALGPGTYNITFQLMTSNNSDNNIVNLQVSTMGVTVLTSETINGSYFSSLNTWKNITLTLNISNFYKYIEFRSYISKWGGKIALKAVYVKQVAKPVRSKEFYDLKKMISFVPDNSTVLEQNNLLDPIPEISTNFKLMQASQINNRTYPEYIISNPTDSYTFTTGLNSMYNITYLFYGSGEYGILAEADGFVLLKLNYTGPIVYYVPLIKYIFK